MEASWGVLEASEGVLEASWGILERSWRHLRASKRRLEVLGEVWESPGGAWETPGTPPYPKARLSKFKSVPWDRGGVPGCIPGGIFSGFRKNAGAGKMLEICACLNLDAMSVPEALVRSIRILGAPAVFLAHQWLKS